MKIYLLAAGYATRLHPLTLDRPKPLLEIGGRPMLSHILDRVLELADVSEIVVIGNHKFADAFESWRRETPCPVPLVLLDDGSTSDEDKLGAIGDLDFALRASPPAEGEAFAVVAGDNWIGFDLRPAEGLFLNERATTSVLLLRRLPEIPAGPSPYNEVKIEADGRVVSFREKPMDPRSDLAAIAVYLFPPEARGLVADYLSQGGNADAPGYFIEWLVRSSRVLGHRFEGEWMDIGSHEALAEARRRFGDLPS